MNFTVPLFLIAFAIGLCQMRPLDIFQVNAWNVGIAKLEPWRIRAGAALRAVRTLAAWFAAVFGLRALTRRQALTLIGATAAFLIVAHVTSAHASHSHVMEAAIVLAPAREMREARERIVGQMKDIAVVEDGKPMTFKNAEDRTKFDAMMADWKAYGVALEDADRGEAFAAASTNRGALPESQRGAADDARPEKKMLERSIELYLRGVPMSDMSKEERHALQGSYRNFTADEVRAAQASLEKRDMSTYSAPAGGFLVPPDTRFYGVIIQAMKFFGGMEAVGSEVIETDTAGDLPIAMGDDTGNVGTIIPEAKVNAHQGGTSPTLTELVLHGYLYSSKVLKVSWQMLRDPAIDVMQYIGGLAGERLARAQNTHFTTGTGNGQPQGLFPIATVGRQSAVGNTTSVPFDDIFRTVHSVDVAYRSARCKWMFNDTNALTLRLAKDGNGRYLWPEMDKAAQAGQPLQLAGYNVVINNDVATMAASAKWASFGDHSYYKIRKIRGITIVRLNELYAESGQVGFLAFQSADGGFADAGQHPVKLLQNSAT